MSYCDWQSQTGYNGTSGSATYPNGPDDSITPYGYGTTSTATNSWVPITEQVVYTKSNPTTCPTWNGHSAPGGFYSISSGGCSSNSVVGGWVQGTTGNSAPCSPMTTPSGQPLKGQVIYIPVFDCMTGSASTTITSTTDCNSGTGNNTFYHVAGYAAFYVTGWHFSSDQQDSIKSGGSPCTGGDRCISGWFLKDLVQAGSIQPPASGGTPNFGLNVIQPAG
jgi:hypothetical protein